LNLKNITAFILNHASQLDDAASALDWTKQSLAAAQTRNHDILTSIDILMTGTYQRLPSIIKVQLFLVEENVLTALQKAVIAPESDTAAMDCGLLGRVEDLIRFRLRTVEILPTEMSNFYIDSGRVYFKVPQLFHTSLTLSGSTDRDGWLFVHVKFLCGSGGTATSIQGELFVLFMLAVIHTGGDNFPTSPSGLLSQFIQDEANSQLRYFISTDNPNLPPGEKPETTQVRLPKGVADAPLVRLYNFLRESGGSFHRKCNHIP
jgi:mediator of RNA polymerase II transcription subunit 14